MNLLPGDALICTPGSPQHAQQSWQFREAAIGSLNAGIMWKHIHQSPSIHLAVTRCPELARAQWAIGGRVHYLAGGYD